MTILLCASVIDEIDSIVYGYMCVCVCARNLFSIHLGKTHTMLGTANEPGIMILAAREIFNGVKEHCDLKFLVRYVHQYSIQIE